MIQTQGSFSFITQQPGDPAGGVESRLPATGAVLWEDWSGCGWEGLQGGLSVGKLMPKFKEA